MLKILFSLFFLLVVALVVPTDVSAQAAGPDIGDGTLVHAYRPVTVTGTQAMRARVNNMTPAPQKRLVCVEAFNQATNNKTHLGCLMVDLAPMGATDRMWAAEFDAPTYWLKPGNYRIVYTYQADDGGWRVVRMMNMQVGNITFTAQ